MRHLLEVSSQTKMQLAMFMGANGAYVTGCYALQHSSTYILSVWMVLLSPVAMKILRLLYEGNSPPLLFGRGKRSKAFMYGDTLILPMVLVCAAHGWHQVEVSWKTNYILALVCLVGIGSLVAFCFSKFDSQRYIELGVASMLTSPTKLWHDWVVVPAVSAMIVWLLLPQLLSNWTAASWWTLSLLGLFALLCVWDAISPPSPSSQHVRWDPQQFQPL